MPGTDAFHTPDALRDKVFGAFGTFEVEANSPFAGCYVPVDQYERNRGVSALMLEIRRDVVAGRRDEFVGGFGRLLDDIEESEGAVDAGG